MDLILIYLFLLLFRDIEYLSASVPNILIGSE